MIRGPDWLLALIALLGCAAGAALILASHPAHDEVRAAEFYRLTGGPAAIPTEESQLLVPSAGKR